MRLVEEWGPAGQYVDEYCPNGKYPGVVTFIRKATSPCNSTGMDFVDGGGNHKGWHLRVEVWVLW